LKKKLIFLGDLDSINLEIIQKSHSILKNEVQYILFGNINEISKYFYKLKTNLRINEIYDPINFFNYKKNSINIFNIHNVSKNKVENLINQIRITNKLANNLGLDLITMPINKSLFKKKISFNGMTEYLAKINSTKTKMLMYGEKFAIVPVTTHINLNNIKKSVDKTFLRNFLKDLLNQINRNLYDLNFKQIKFLCYNPHCSEANSLGDEDKIISQTISNFKKISGPFAADSAFKKIDRNNLFISMYHDQALIPFKILNKKGFNLTLGLKYRRLSPSHGTANDIKFKNLADITSYIACMKF